MQTPTTSFYAQVLPCQLVDPILPFMANLRAVQYLWEVKVFENAQPKIFW